MLLLCSDIGQVYRFIFYSNPHQLVFKLDEFALPVYFFLHKIVPDELLDLFIKWLYLDVLALDHTI